MRRSAEEVREKVVRRMAEIDALTAEQRKVVHVYGWRIVKDFMAAGVRNPKTIDNLVRAVLLELSPIYAYQHKVRKEKERPVSEPPQE